MFKVGDKIQCINNKNLNHLNKLNQLKYFCVYTVTDSMIVGIKINDLNCIYSETRFLLLSEQRRNKLNKINNYEYNM